MPTKEIEDACPLIQEHWPRIRMDFTSAVPGHYLRLACVHRSPSEQFELFKKGRKEAIPGGGYITDEPSQIVTNVDGKRTLGAHNYKPARAVDVEVVNNQTGKVTWDEKFFLPLGPIVKSCGLVWGGDWDGDGDRTDQKLVDMPHIEVPNYKTNEGNV